MFYVEENDKIVLFNEDRQTLENTLEFMPQYEGLEIKETDRPIVDFEWADTPEWEEKQAQKERERIAKLSLTKREVFLALYRAKGLTPDMIRAQITNPEALIEFDYATEYYRFNPLIDQIGEMLGFSPEQINYLFEYRELPVPDNLGRV